MNNDEILKLATEQPLVAESLTNALRSVIEFQNGRMRLLRALTVKPELHRPELKIVHSEGQS